MAEVGFDVPALAVEGRDVGRRITFWIEQRGGDRDNARATATRDDRVTQLAYGEAIRQGRVGFGREPVGARFGLDVFDQLVVASQTLEPARGWQSLLAPLA